MAAMAWAGCCCGAGCWLWARLGERLAERLLPGRSPPSVLLPRKRSPPSAFAFIPGRPAAKMTPPPSSLRSRSEALLASENLEGLRSSPRCAAGLSALIRVPLASENLRSLPRPLLVEDGWLALDGLRWSSRLAGDAWLVLEGRRWSWWMHAGDSWLILEGRRWSWRPDMPLAAEGVL